MTALGPDTRMRDLVHEHPAARKVLARHGMHCPTCRGAETDTIRHAAQNHGIPQERLLSELRAALRQGP